MKSVGIITGFHHTVKKFMVKSESGRLPKGWTARILILRLPDGTAQAYLDLYEFFVAKWTYSDTWQIENARALGLFWDYTTTRTPMLPPNMSLWEQTRELFRGFSNALLFGTISNDIDDPLQLYWQAQPVHKVRKYISHIEQFGLWVAIEKGEIPSTRPINAISSLGGRAIVTMVCEARKRGFKLLGYLGDPSPARESIIFLPNVGGAFNHEGEYRHSFPPGRIEELIWEGFKKPGKDGESWDDYNIRDMMICLLCAYAGLREHEPYHIWVQDVIEDPNQPGLASVFLYHPVHGLAYIDGPDGRQTKSTRTEYLKRNFSLTPRTSGSGGYKVGWKNSKTVTKDYYAVLYFTDPIASALFWELYRNYIPRREAIMAKRRNMGYGDHPFLFVSEQEARNLPDGAKFYGAPASIDSFERSLRKAVENVLDITYSKDSGTTPHGLRHMYAYTLKALGVDGKIIQEGLRHKHPYSHLVYGIPSPTDIDEQIKMCMQRGREALPDGISLERSLKWLEDRYPELRILKGGLFT